MINNRYRRLLTYFCMSYEMTWHRISLSQSKAVCLFCDSVSILFSSLLKTHLHTHTQMTWEILRWSKLAVWPIKRKATRQHLNGQSSLLTWKSLMRWCNLFMWYGRKKRIRLAAIYYYRIRQYEWSGCF